jgi:hypothetical protein
MTQTALGFSNGDPVYLDQNSGPSTAFQTGPIINVGNLGDVCGKNVWRDILSRTRWGHLFGVVPDLRCLQHGASSRIRQLGAAELRNVRVSGPDA